MSAVASSGRQIIFKKLGTICCVAAGGFEPGFATQACFAACLSHPGTFTQHLAHQNSNNVLSCAACLTRSATFSQHQKQTTFLCPLLDREFGTHQNCKKKSEAPIRTRLNQTCAILASDFLGYVFYGKLLFLLVSGVFACFSPVQETRPQHSWTPHFHPLHKTAIP